MEKKSWIVSEELIAEAKKLREEGYTARSITALTGLPASVLSYYFYPKRRAYLVKYKKEHINRKKS